MDHNTARKSSRNSQLPMSSYTQLVAPSIHSLIEKLRELYALIKLSQKRTVIYTLLTYRATRLQNGMSPSKLLMGRRLRTQFPVLPSTLQPGSQKPDIREKEERYRDNQKRNFDRRHNAKDMSNLQPGENVWAKDQKRYGQIIERTSEPRS